MTECSVENCPDCEFELETKKAAREIRDWFRQTGKIKGTKQILRRAKALGVSAADLIEADIEAFKRKQ